MALNSPIYQKKWSVLRGIRGDRGITEGTGGGGGKNTVCTDK